MPCCHGGSAETFEDRIGEHSMLGAWQDCPCGNVVTAQGEVCLFWCTLPQGLQAIACAEELTGPWDFLCRIVTALTGAHRALPCRAPLLQVRWQTRCKVPQLMESLVDLQSDCPQAHS